MHPAPGKRERSAFEPPDSSEENISLDPRKVEAREPIVHVTDPEQQNKSLDYQILFPKPLSSDEPSTSQKQSKPNEVNNHKTLEVGMIRRLDAFGLSMPNEKYFSSPSTISHEPVRMPHRLEMIEWRQRDGYNLENI